MNSNDHISFGIHPITAMLQEGSKRIKEVVVAKERKDKRLQKLIDLAKGSGVRIRFADKTSFDRLIKNHDLSDKSHQGALAICTPVAVGNEADLDNILDKTEKPLLLILDGVTDPHNIGACLRTADASGVTAVVTPKDKSGTLTATAVKIASGAAETVPFIQVTNLARTLKHLATKGIWIYGTAGEAKQTIYESTFSLPMALIMGAEGDGMRRLTRENCDQLVKIPMLGQVSSLNVSVATGVCLFEIQRQILTSN